jgi:hypothetical protein
MTDEILDKILKELYDRKGTNSDTPGPDFLESLGIENASINTVRLLETKGCIKTYHNNTAPHWYLKLTPEGAQFILQGGFCKQTYFKEEPIRIANESVRVSNESLEIAKKSISWAKVAIAISIVSILVAIILFVLNK